ncbi:hypothetical protein O0L34_g5232 [Tuta absoluta]|nr:hypothetical protein O0L34_g5232 [Tuta absoluta]
MNIIRYSSIILFLLLKLVLLEVSATWHMGVGHENIVKEIMRRNEGLNLTYEDPKWIVQRLDHFHDQETRTWNMRYFEHLEYFQQNGPIFIFIGGEGSVYGEMFRGSLLDEFAKETHGAIFTSEHRYYGLSMPLDKSVTENLKYLSSEQALADIAHLIKSIKSQPRFERSKVVAVGGSYAGNLAA